MECRVCKEEMIVRSGPYGEFYCCANSRPGDNHGTRSIGVRRMLNAVAEPNYPGPAPDLHAEVNREMVKFGLPIEYVDDFLLEDDPYDEFGDPNPDHWENFRPW